MGRSSSYIIGFATAVCLVSSIVVTGSAVTLKDRQEANKALDRQKKVLSVAGLLPEQSSSADEIKKIFSDNIVTKAVTLKTGDYNDAIEVASYDQLKASKDPSLSVQAPDNTAKVQRVPNDALVYHVVKNGDIELVILPIEGKGLWSTLYGFLALENDTNTVRGITFYQHGETPGLGGEIDNPRWKSLWKDRKAFDTSWQPALNVIKGQAGGPDKDPHKVDGLSGATITSRGVGNLVQFWLSDEGFGPYLASFRKRGS